MNNIQDFTTCNGINLGLQRSACSISDVTAMDCLSGSSQVLQQVVEDGDMTGAMGCYEDLTYSSSNRTYAPGMGPDYFSDSDYSETARADQQFSGDEQETGSTVRYVESQLSTPSSDYSSWSSPVPSTPPASQPLAPIQIFQLPMADYSVSADAHTVGHVNAVDHIAVPPSHSAFCTWEVVQPAPMMAPVRSKAEQVEDLAFRQALVDVQQAQQLLHLPSDPVFWSKEHVRAWLAWTYRRYNLVHYADLTRFDFEGSQLVSLRETDFLRLAPACGSFLWHMLDVWRAAGQERKPLEAQNFIVSPHPTFDISPFLHAQPNGPGMFVDNRYFLSGGGVVTTGAPEMFMQNEIKPVRRVKKPKREVVKMEIFDQDFDVGGSGNYLWQFLKELLNRPEVYSSIIHWTDREQAIFLIVDSAEVARLWGRRKNCPMMNFDKLSRSIRQYYKKGIMKKPPVKRRLYYQFCPAYAF